VLMVCLPLWQFWWRCIKRETRRCGRMLWHALSMRLLRPGDYRVSIVGSQANDRWEMKITGPNGFERSYTLEGSSGQHEPEVIRVIVGKMVPGNL
jgi:hypothetical protein